MKHVRLALLSILVGFSWLGNAYACSCAPFVGRNANGAIVVSGTIEADIEGSVQSPWGAYSTRLVADTVWFGPDQRVFQLVAPPIPFTTCGGLIAGQPGQRIVAWLHPFSGTYHSISPCSAVGWEDKDREAAEASLRSARARYDDIDDRLAAKPDDADLWRERLKIASDLKDVHGQLRSLRRLVELTAAPGLDILQEAATAADAARNDEAAVEYAERGLQLTPSDNALMLLRQRASLRSTYTKEALATTKDLRGVSWKDARDEHVRIELVRLENFQIRNSTFSGLLEQSKLSLGLISNSSLSQLIVRDGVLSGVLMRDVRMAGTRFDNTKIELGRIDHNNLSGARFSKTRIQQTEIVDTPMRGTEMRDVVFAGSGLIRADLSRAKLIGVDFLGVMLDAVDFTGASLEEVRFRNVSLRAIDLSRVADLQMTDAVIDCRTKLPAGFDLLKTGTIVDAPTCDGKPNNRDFTRLPFAKRWSWEKLDLTGANFAGVNSRHLVFSYSVLRGADFSDAKIETLMAYKVDLRDARFTGATIGAGKRGGTVDFRFADLRGADFSSAVIGDARYAFRDAKYDARTKWPATFTDFAGKSYPFDPVALGAILVKD